MKIAICISGSMRELKQSIESINKIKEKYNCLVFIHTWFNIADPYQTDNDKILTLNSYNPISCLIEDYRKKEKILSQIYENVKFLNIAHGYHNSVRSISMFYSIYQANKLKKDFENENQMEFDCVIRMRFDSKIINDFKLEEYDLSSINIPEGRDWYGYNDQFALGCSSKMDIYSDIINNLHNTSELYHPETILKKHLEYHNLNINRIPLDVRIRNEY